MSSLRQHSWPGWAVAVGLHALVLGWLLLTSPPPRHLPPRRPPVSVKLVTRNRVKPPAPPRTAEPRAVPEAPSPRPRLATARVTRSAPRSAAAAAAPVPSPAPAPRPGPAPRPRFAVSMSATVPSGGVAVPVSPSPSQRLLAAPDWAREPSAGPRGDGDGAADAVRGPSGARPVEVEAASTPPRLVARPDAEVLRAAYPAQARTDGLEADVSLKILVDTSGRVSQVRLLRGAGGGFDEAARRLISRFRFEAGRDRGGRPVPVWIPWTYKFRLNG